ncbi:hypothetical protein Taro_027286, partial [Colocasia esculenta]|nr:hypothetical protein [Colocasia esculenta]
TCEDARPIHRTGLRAVRIHRYPHGRLQSRRACQRVPDTRRPRLFSCPDQLKALAVAAAMSEEAMVDVPGSNPPPAPAPADGGEADDWSRELDDTPALPPAAPAEENLAPPPPASDGVSELRSDLQSLQLEPNASARDSEMDVQREEEEVAETGKRHLNVVFIGHVDAGKSTIGGQILLLSGQVDERTIQKYEKEAKDKSRESWYMAYIMDTNEEERVKGITVEVGRARFETENTRFTILDAPGHKSYVPNMISGASQADIGVLVISARKGEFETGYEKGGQTREHVQLAKTLGVSKLIVVVNKMDEQTVKWSKERYDEIESKMLPFLKSSGYNKKGNKLSCCASPCPITALLMFSFCLSLDCWVITSRLEWILRSVGGGVGHACLKSLMLLKLHLEILKALSGRDPLLFLNTLMPIIDKFKDMGTMVMGKIESGTIREGNSLVVMPNKVDVKVLAVYCDDIKVNYAGPGENVKIKLAGISDEDILAGFVLSSVAKPVPAVNEFNAQLQILELLDNAIFTAGYKAVLHIHSIVEECEIVDLIQEIDTKKKSTDPKKKPKRKPLFVKNGAVVVCRVQVNNLICIEKFSDFPQLGRFTLRTEGKTIAIGKVVDLPPTGSAAFSA